jgi:penicillin-binding protein 1A
MWRYRRILFLVGLLGFTAVAGVLFVLSRVPLPDAAPEAQTTFLYAADGSRLATLTGTENRISVELQSVPKVVRHAVLATEDKTFYEHSGVDPFGILRATVNDLRGGSLQGGSTITQQYVKNTYVGTERTVWRKLKEAVLAVKIERELTKDELLERYLNTVYFGRGAYGVQAASQAYFGKDVNQIGLREGAYLAGLIRAPELADVTKDPVTATNRRNRTLTQMVDNGFITADDASEVRKQNLASYVVGKRNMAPRVVASEAGTEYVVDYIRRILVRDYGEQVVLGGGLRVKTTIDVAAQRAAYSAVYGVLNRANDPSGALVAIDDEGRVRALVGGKNFNDSKVNLAMGADGGGRGRQPGSTFKPFLLAEAVREGYSLESAFPGPAEIVLPKADAGKDWPVHNYEDASFGSNVNLIEATRHSVNTVYAQATNQIGPQKLMDMAKELGVRAPLRPVASLVLGTVEVAPIDIASAYSTLARRGERIDPQFIETIETADGKVLFRRNPQPTRVLTREQADAVNTALTQVMERGTGVNGRLKGAAPNTLIGKTGTTQDYGDAWFVGASTKLTAAVWMGYPEGNSRTLARFRGGKPVSGGTVPADIWRRFMTSVTKGQELTPFPTVTKFSGKVLGNSRTSYKLPNGSTTSTTSSGGARVTVTTTPRRQTTSTSSPPSPPSVDAPSNPTTTSPGPLGLGAGDLVVGIERPARDAPVLDLVHHRRLGLFLAPLVQFEVHAADRDQADRAGFLASAVLADRRGCIGHAGNVHFWCLPAAMGRGTGAKEKAMSGLKPVTVPDVRASKGQTPLVMVTAYDAPTARIADDAGVDMILVGDSVAMVVLGYDDTLQVTIDDMAHHTAAVARTNPRALIVGDLPWMSYHSTREEAVHNAAKLIRAGAKCVKLEGGAKRVPVIEAIVDAEIPVMGHLGLTPQSINALGGFKVQGRTTEAARMLIEDAKALVHAGVFAIVLECVPNDVAQMVTDAIDVPTIGIGAGNACDGQVLVMHDLLGLEDRVTPKFVRRYAEMKRYSVDAVQEYAADVRARTFPGPDEGYKLPGDVAEELSLYGGGARASMSA